MAASQSAPGPLGIALLGVTHPHSSARLRAFRAQPGVSVLAVAETGPLGQVFADNFDLELAPIDQVLDRTDIDAVLVHSRTGEMVDLAIAAIDAGKSVLVEKPCGNGPSDIRRLVDVTERSDVTVQSGYAIRTSPVIEETKNVLDSGAIGDIITVRVNGSCALGEHTTPLLNEPGDIGGALWVIGCHLVDMLIHILGMPTSVRATIEKLAGRSDARSREDAASVQLRYRDKLVSFVFNAQDPLGNLESWRLSFAGTAGVYEAAILPAVTELFATGPAGGWVRRSDTAFPVPFSGEPTSFSPDIPAVANISFYEEEARGFVAAVRAGTPPTATALDALQVASVIDAAYESSRLGGLDVVPG